MRPYQSRAVEMLRQHIRERPILCLPTGAGKTACAAEVVRRANEKGKRSLFLCDRREILLKTRDDFEELGIPTGIILSGRVQRERPHMVAAAQTLAKRGLPPADLLIVDECHRALSVTQERIVREYPTRIGLSATPCREDAKGLGRLFGCILEPHPVRWYIDNGWLADFRYLAPLEPDLKGVRRVRGDFEQAPAVERMSRRHVVAGAIAAYQQHLAGRSAILFAITRDHSRAMAEAFRAAGVPALHCDGDTPKKERAQALRDLSSGALRVLCNVDLWSYGVDVKDLDGAILLRPTHSIQIARQQPGRALRPKPHKAVILDLAGNCQRLGLLPDTPILWSLADGLTRPASVNPLSRCLKCYAIFPHADFQQVCPSCGATREAAQIVVQHHDAELKEIKVAPPKQPVPDAMRLLLAEAHAKGYVPRWAVMAFWRKHGYPARGDFTKAAREESDGCLLPECRFCGAIHARA